MSNTGHGHVIPRADGAKARCGGPALCAVCRREAAQRDLNTAVMIKQVATVVTALSLVVIPVVCWLTV